MATMKATKQLEAQTQNRFINIEYILAVGTHSNREYLESNRMTPVGWPYCFIAFHIVMKVNTRCKFYRFQHYTYAVMQFNSPFLGCEGHQLYFIEQFTTSIYSFFFLSKMFIHCGIYAKRVVAHIRLFLINIHLYLYLSTKSVLLGNLVPTFKLKPTATCMCADIFSVKLFVMTSSNGNIFLRYWPGNRWIPLTKANDAMLCVLWYVPE